MATVIWMAVFCFLCFELFIVALLVLPLPRSVRKWMARTIRRLNLGPRVRFATQWITFMLLAAVVESFTTLKRLESRDDPSGTTQTAKQFDGAMGYMGMSIDKQRKFRAERNLYLSTFALTLLFVIARLVELMQENVKFEEEKDTAKARLSNVADTASTSQIPENGSEHSGLRRRAVAAATKSD